MTCQHPNCSHLIHSICTNHCHWSLCQEHLNEHKNSLLIEFEEVLENLIKPTNEFSKTIDEIKKNLNYNQEKELDNLKKSYEKQLNNIEKNFIEINQLQNQLNKISENLIQIKTNENILTQNDFQHIDNLSKQIQHFNSNKQEEQLKSLDTKIIIKDNKQPCPLHNTSEQSGIRSTPCTSFVTEKFLPIHLKTVHRLRLPQIKEILKTN